MLSTEKGYSGLGHNSVVLGPSLDEFYVAYHKLDWVDEKRTTRYLCIDRLYFNGRDTACNISNFEISDAKRPYFECDISQNSLMTRYKEFLLTPNATKEKFTSEFNVKGYSDIIVGFQDEFNYNIISLNKKIEILPILSENSANISTRFGKAKGGL